MSADPTPYELLRAENTDLRARIQLAEDRAFEQGAEIARLRAEKADLLTACKSALELLTNPDAEVWDADRVTIALRQALAKAKGGQA